MRAHGTRCLLVSLLLGCATPSAAVDCTINVLAAYDVAKLRGWSFKCETPPLNVGMTVGFVTYPPDGIGCTFKTPPVLGPITFLGGGQFFRSLSVPEGRPALKNGWRVKTYEISGAQWNAWPDAPKEARVPMRSSETPKPSKTYNFRLNKLVLTHPTSTCAKALNEAF